jgi:alpha-methylacyl-CoA racemase
MGISFRAMAGPLQGIRIVEMAGLGPGPFAAMMLADHGAEVIRVERAGMIGISGDPLLRSRRSISLDLKQAAARQAVRRLAERSDGLIEGFRPGVMERLGLGPTELLEANPRLVYGRITGWGQYGPLAQEAGHDIDYVALTGLLHGIGPKDRPVAPINYLGDFAGGGLMLAFAMVSALLHVRSGGDGQVIDAAMTDGAALVGALTYGLRGAGRWADERESNLLDGGDPAYRVYRCADGKFLAVGAIEPQFRCAFFVGLGLPENATREDVEANMATRTRDEWVRHFAGKEACVAAVLDLSEAPAHPHNVARGTFIELDGVIQPGPAPRYSATANDSPRPPRSEGEDGEAILAELGYSPVEVAEMREQGALL